MKNIQQHVGSSILFGLALLTPVWFLPFTADGFGVQKQFLLVLAAAILGFLWIAKIVREKRVLFSVSPVNIAAVILVVATAISAGLAQNSAFQVSGRFLSVLGMALLLVFGFSNFVQFSWKKLLSALTWGTVALGVTTWWQFLLPDRFTFSHLINTAFKTQFNTGVEFTLAESPAVLLALLIPVLIANGIIIWKNHFQNDMPFQKARVQLGTTLFLFATAIAVGFILFQNPNARPVLLPYAYGWGIAIENWKQLPRLLFGIGPEQFLVAFHRFRDVTYNLSDLWSLRFRASSSEALHSITTIGLVGFFSWIGIYLSGFWTGRKIFKENPALFVFFVLQAALFWLLPFSATMFIVLGLTLLAIIEEARKKDPTTAQDIVVLLSAIQLAPSGQLKTKKTHAGFAYASALVLGLGLATLSYFSGRVYAANLFYARSLHAAQNNEVTKTYDLQRTAIALHPYNTQFRRSYSSTNLAIARALAQNPDLTDEQRQVFAQLLQQSIRESRLAAQINPTETENWEHLATIYSNMLDVEGSPRWASAALIQAVQTDPLSPQLRVQIGNLYITLGEADQSLRYFEQAIQLKPDWHVAYYRYGVALQEMEQPGLAVQAFERALSLLNSEDEDYSVVEEAFLDAQAEAQAQQAEANQDAETTTEIPNPEAPSVPEATQQGNNGPGFDQLLESDPLQENQNAEQGNTSNNDSGNFVLPDDVGF